MRKDTKGKNQWNLESSCLWRVREREDLQMAACFRSGELCKCDAISHESEYR